jgi:hypothetical protein
MGKRGKRRGSDFLVAANSRVFARKDKMKVYDKWYEFTESRRKVWLGELCGLRVSFWESAGWEGSLTINLMKIEIKIYY